MWALVSELGNSLRKKNSVINVHAKIPNKILANRSMMQQVYFEFIAGMQDKFNICSLHDGNVVDKAPKFYIPCNFLPLERGFNSSNSTVFLQTWVDRTDLCMMCVFRGGTVFCADIPLIKSYRPQILKPKVRTTYRVKTHYLCWPTLVEVIYNWNMSLETSSRNQNFLPVK